MSLFSDHALDRAGSCGSHMPRTHTKSPRSPRAAERSPHTLGGSPLLLETRHDPPPSQPPPPLCTLRRCALRRVPLCPSVDWLVALPAILAGPTPRWRTGGGANRVELWISTRSHESRGSLDRAGYRLPHTIHSPHRTVHCYLHTRLSRKDTETQHPTFGVISIKELIVKTAPSTVPFAQRALSAHLTILFAQHAPLALD